jgi:hypothetical protein
MEEMLAAVFSIVSLAALPDCVPLRWSSSAPTSLELLRDTPFQCLVLDRAHWSAAFVEAASARGIRTLGAVRTPEDLAAAGTSGLGGFVLEGDFEPAAVAALASKAPVAELGSRSRLLTLRDAPVAGTTQALWPGVRPPDENNKTQAAPSGAPWINTNGGFLRFARALVPATLWIGQRVPPGLSPTVEQYIAAMADAYVGGARWIVTLDDDFSSRLLAGEARAVRDWKRLCASAAFFEQKVSWLRQSPAGLLAIVQDVDSGAALSAGLLDMLGSRHTPTRIIPTRALTPESLRGVSLAVNVEPEAVSSAGREALRAYTRSGGKLFNSPPGWHFPKADGFVLALDKLSKDEVAHFDLIWKQITSQTWNRNLGARLYNVASMLSHLVSTPDGARSYLFLVNYSGYAAESVTVHVPGRFSSALLHTPEAAGQKLEAYEIEEGTGIDIARFGVVGIVELVR